MKNLHPIFALHSMSSPVSETPSFQTHVKIGVIQVLYQFLFKERDGLLVATLMCLPKHNISIPILFQIYSSFNEYPEMIVCYFFHLPFQMFHFKSLFVFLPTVKHLFCLLRIRLQIHFHALLVEFLDLSPLRYLRPTDYDCHL